MFNRHSLFPETVLHDSLRGLSPPREVASSSSWMQAVSQSATDYSHYFAITASWRLQRQPVSLLPARENNPTYTIITGRCISLYRMKNINIPETVNTEEEREKRKGKIAPETPTVKIKGPNFSHSIEKAMSGPEHRISFKYVH
ncbi:hypothetical protein CEXT_57551 [Caerostris extrusa]|uniref:Uncharacterized protein n=1 Tax=Caerostris extrusa TaxID=172846 RepID=A0AAV4NSA8_CAEEX|nr:hypothetical protein CEXT_57551 [Caerostris extrusa]